MDITSPPLSPNDYAPILVIVLMPLLGAIVNGLFGKRLGKWAIWLLIKRLNGT